MKDIIEVLNKVDTEGEKATTNLQDAVNVRDHLMLTLTYINALRASNLINITLKEVHTTKPHDELEALVFKNNKYKTSLICGAKVILVPTLTNHHIQLYIKYLRPLLILDSHRALKDIFICILQKR